MTFLMAIQAENQVGNAATDVYKEILIQCELQWSTEN